MDAWEREEGGKVAGRGRTEAGWTAECRDEEIRPPTEEEEEVKRLFILSPNNASPSELLSAPCMQKLGRTGWNLNHVSCLGKRGGYNRDLIRDTPLQFCTPVLALPRGCTFSRSRAPSSSSSPREILSTSSPPGEISSAKRGREGRTGSSWCDLKFLLKGDPSLLALFKAPFSLSLI